MKIIATHLLNDYSGSPKVLMQLIKGWVKNDISVDLHTCNGREGFLSNLAGVSYYSFTYKWAANPLLRLFNLMVSQLFLCINILKSADKEDIIYINTVLPFGAALAGKIRGNKVVYHLHETSIKPAVLKVFLFGIVKWCATDIIYVSNYLAATEPIEGKRIHVLHNAIENDFLAKAKTKKETKSSLKNILMVCSLKAYKGINEFVAIAKLMPTMKFKLVLNASTLEMDEYFAHTSMPSNLTLYPTQSDVHPFYHWADVVLNLSKKDQWVETFGLTLIEGMAYGNPAIAPTVGGVTEIVQHEKNGALLDSDKTSDIVAKLADWAANDKYFGTLKRAAKETVKNFDENTLITKNIQLLTAIK